MRFIQAGILICLLAITGLLFGIYRQQGQLQASAASEMAQAAAKAAEPEAIEAEVIEPLEPPPAIVETSAPKPTPVVKRAAAARPPAPVEKPLPAAVEPPVTVASAPQTAVTPVEEPTMPEPARSVEAEPGTVAEGEPVADPEPEPAEPLVEEIPAAPREPRVVTLPAGQRLTVRLDSTLSTSRSRVDDTFFVTLDEPVIVDGLIIADKGARLEGRVTESEQAGRVKGLARLACELTRLHTDDGQRVEIRSSTFALDGPSSRNEDLRKVAVGAGAGAILGAIFGGGKGAAIGAASGAGAGAGTAAATRGEPAVIEPETRMDFRLSEAISITEKL